LNLTVFNLERMPNWEGVMPEIILLIFAVAVILLDLFTARKRALAIVSLIGIVLSVFLSWCFWGTRLSFFNNMLAIDQFTVFFRLLLLGTAFLVILTTADYAKKFERFQGEYYALILLSTTGMMFMASATDLITIYIATELTSISLYVLVSFLKDNKSTEASLKYLLLGAVASAVMLYGMAMVFGFTGQTQLGAIADTLTKMKLTSLVANPALMVGIIMLIAGFGFKIAAVPFQMWVPDVYEGAPTPITAYLSVASKAAGFAVILRIFFSAFGKLNGITNDWGMIFAVLAVITMIVGNVTAIPQANIKRMLGYSSIAQAGYLMVGLATLGYAPANSAAGQSGVIFFLAAYALTNIGAFTAIIAITNTTGSDEIDDFSGMGKRAPLTALALTFCLISLIGIPPAAGFMAKFFLFRAAVLNNLLWVVIIAVINSVISAFYYLRVVKVMWFNEPASLEKVPSSAGPRLSLILCSLGVLLLGVIPGSVMRLAEIAAKLLK
jgi:NADH-quinone oxidoreductase subunit N